MSEKNVNNVTVNHEEVAAKLSNMLKDSGWHALLKGFLVSEDFKKILETLNTMVNDGQRFTPPLKQVFRAFQECPISDLKVIMVGQDPYPQLGVADGISFSCGNTRKMEASLRYIFKAVNDTVYEGKSDIKQMDPDLARWSNQGILMLNTSLTTEIGKIGKHFGLWDPFIKYVFDMLNSQEQPLIWVFMGKKAQELEDLISDHHIILKCSHPASAAYQKESLWDSGDLFNNINAQLKELKAPTIVW